MSERQRGSKNVFYHDLEFVHAFRFFYESDGVPAHQNGRSRVAYLVVGRDEAGEMVHDTAMSDADRIEKLKGDYLPLLEACVRKMDEPALAPDRKRVIECVPFSAMHESKLIVRQSSDAYNVPTLRGLLKTLGFEAAADGLDAGGDESRHYGYLKSSISDANALLAREVGQKGGEADEAYAMVALPYLYNRNAEGVYEAKLLNDHASVALMPRIVVEYGVFFDGTKNSMYNIDFNNDFYGYLSEQTNIVLDKNARFFLADGVDRLSDKSYPNAATYIREVEKPDKSAVINRIRDEIQERVRYFEVASQDKIAGEETKYKQHFQDRASEHADKTFDFLAALKKRKVRVRGSQTHTVKGLIDRKTLEALHEGTLPGEYLAESDLKNKYLKEGKLEGDDAEAVEVLEHYREEIIKEYVYDEILPAGEGSSYVNGYTNIKRLFEHYKGFDPLNPSADINPEAHRYSMGRFKVYASGDGCIDPLDKGQMMPDSKHGLGLALGETGVKAHIVYTCEKIAKNLREQECFTVDELVLDVFGFSRGAAEARHFVCSIIKEYGLASDAVRSYTLDTASKETNIFSPFYEQKNGLYTKIGNRYYFNPLRTDVEKIPVQVSAGSRTATIYVFNPYYKYYKKNQVRPINVKTLSFRFVGIYDTVPHYGIQQDDDHEDLNLDFDSTKVRRVVHLTAKDEYRKNFAMSRVRIASNIQEIELPGAHADVGGGYLKRNDAPRYILDASKRYRQLLRKWTQKYAWIAPGTLGESDRGSRGIVTEVEDTDEIIRHGKPGFYRVDDWGEDSIYMYRPNIGNEYELVTMKLMHYHSLDEKDVSERVPLTAILPQYTYNDELLKTVYEQLKTQSFEMNGVKHKELRQAYLHHSADLDGIAPVDVNAPSMEGFDLDTAKDEIYGLRVIYDPS